MTEKISQVFDRFTTNHILENVADERRRQHEKWGVQHHSDGTSATENILYHTDCNLDLRSGRELADIFRAVCDRAARTSAVTWRHILLEEVFEALAETDAERLVDELLQVAAVAVAWIEDIRSREAE